MYGKVDDVRGERALLAAVDAGATLIDTADGYGGDGLNERLIGRALRGRRDDVAIATKFGFRLPAGVEPHPFPVGFAFGELAVNGDPKHVRGYAEASLRELGTDYIDLYYPHFPDPLVPLEDTVGAVAELIEAGLVRHLDLSNVTAGQLRAAHAVHPVAAVQTEWSMWRPVAPDLLAAARELGAGVVAWSPLGAGPGRACRPDPGQPYAGTHQGELVGRAGRTDGGCPGTPRRDPRRHRGPGRHPVVAQERRLAPAQTRSVKSLRTMAPRRGL